VRGFPDALEDALLRSRARSNSEQAVAGGAQANARVLKAASRECQAKLSQFHAQCLASLAWSLAKLGILDAPLMRGIAAEALAKIKE